MKKLARAGKAAALPALLFGSLLLAACDSDKPHLSDASSGDLGAPALGRAAASPTAVHPLPPRGNGQTTGGFGGSTVQSKTLPSAPNSPGAPAPPAPPASSQPPAVANAPAAPAPASASIQSRSIPRDRLILRERMVYVAEGKLWSVGGGGNDPSLILSDPALGGPSGMISQVNPSPNGRRILYTIDAGLPSQRVFMIDLDQAMLISEKHNGAWSPDGKHIVLSDYGKLVVANVEDGSVENLGDGDNANWTSSNQVIAVREGNIWMLPYPASSGKSKQVTNFPQSGAFVFSNRLQYDYTNRILFIGGEADKLDASGNGLSLWSVDISTGRITQVATPGGNSVSYLELSPSGTQIAWAQQARKSACSSIGSVGWAQLSGAKQAVLAALPQSDDDFYQITGLSWSPGQQLAFSGIEQNCAGLTLNTLAPERIFILDPAHADAPRALLNGSNPVWITAQGLGELDLGLVAER